MPQRSRGRQALPTGRQSSVRKLRPIMPSVAVNSSRGHVSAGRPCSSGCSQRLGKLPPHLMGPMGLGQRQRLATIRDRPCPTHLHHPHPIDPEMSECGLALTAGRAALRNGARITGASAGQLSPSCAVLVGGVPGAAWMAAWLARQRGCCRYSQRNRRAAMPIKIAAIATSSASCGAISSRPAPSIMTARAPATR